jgi:hypothetical protein
MIAQEEMKTSLLINGHHVCISLGHCGHEVRLAYSSKKKYG